MSVSAVRPLESFEVQSSSDHIEFSGDFRLCLPEDSNDDDCDVISGSGEVETTSTPRSEGDLAASSTTGHRRFVYVERTTSERNLESDDGTTSGESLVIVVEMTERSLSRRTPVSYTHLTLPTKRIV